MYLRGDPSERKDVPQDEDDVKMKETLIHRQKNYGTNLQSMFHLMKNHRYVRVLAGYLQQNCASSHQESMQQA